MKLHYKSSKIYNFLILLIASILLVSCGSYQNVSNNDGIYDDTTFTKKERPVVVLEKKEYQEYEDNYFTKELDRLNTIDDNEIFVDVDSYNSGGDNINDNEFYNENSPWGYENNDVVVNVNLVDPFWGGNGFGWGWNNPWAFNNWNYWGWNDPFWGGGPFWRNRFWGGNRFWAYNPYWNPYQNNWAWGGAFWGGSPYWNNWGWNNRYYRNQRYGARVINNRFGRRTTSNGRYSVTSRRNNSFNSNSRVRRNTNSNYSRGSSSNVRRNTSTNRRNSSTIRRSSQRRGSSTIRRGSSSRGNNRTINRSSSRGSSSRGYTPSRRSSTSRATSSRSSSSRSSSSRSSSRGSSRNSSRSKRDN